MSCVISFSCICYQTATNLNWRIQNQSKRTSYFAYLLQFCTPNITYSAFARTPSIWLDQQRKSYLPACFWHIQPRYCCCIPLHLYHKGSMMLNSAPILTLVSILTKIRTIDFRVTSLGHCIRQNRKTEKWQDLFWPYASYKRNIRLSSCFFARIFKFVHGTHQNISARALS